MKLKTTYLLFAMLLAAMVCFFVAQFMGVKRAGQTQAWVFPQSHPQDKPISNDKIDVDTLEIIRHDLTPETSFTFKKGEQGWALTEPIPVRIEDWRVSTLIEKILNARPEKGKATSPLSEYGLDEPRVTVTLTSGESKRQLFLGAETAGTTNKTIFVRSSERPADPLQMKREELAALFNTLNDWRSRTLLSSDTNPVEKITLSAGAVDKTLKLGKASAGDWAYLEPEFGPAEREGAPAGGGKEITGVKRLLEHACNLSVGKEYHFVEAAVSEAALREKYGLLPQPTTLRIEVERKEKSFSPLEITGEKDKPKPEGKAVTEVLLVGNKAPEPTSTTAATKDKADKPEQKQGYYALLESDKNAVVWLADDAIAPLLELVNQRESLRNKDLLLGVNKDDIDVLQVKNSSGTFKLVKPEANHWRVERDKKPHQVGNLDEVNRLITVLGEKRQIRDFPKSEAGSGLEKPLAELWLWSKAVKKKNDKPDAVTPWVETELDVRDPDKPDMKLSFGAINKDTNQVYVRREMKDGKPLIFTIPSALVERAQISALLFLDRSLPAFSDSLNPAEEVAKIVISRLGETFEIVEVKQKGPSLWKFTQPKDLENRYAHRLHLEAMLRRLARVVPLQFVSEQVQDEKILDQEFGLKSPTVKVALTLKKGDKPEEHLFSLGKEASDKHKPGYYALYNKRDIVFTIDESYRKDILGDLLDPFVFKFEIEKVKAVKFTGWQDGSVPSVLEVERENSNKWNVKAPAGFMLDDAKPEKLLEVLRDLHASSMLYRKGPVATNPMFDVKKGGLQIELSFKDDTKPLQLTLGERVDKEKGEVYALSPSVNNVFTLPAEPWGVLLTEKRGYFAKK